jgi:hypothetical protein
VSSSIIAYCLLLFIKSNPTLHFKDGAAPSLTYNPHFQRKNAFGQSRGEQDRNFVPNGPPIAIPRSWSRGQAGDAEGQGDFKFKI